LINVNWVWQITHLDCGKWHALFQRLISGLKNEVAMAAHGLPQPARLCAVSRPDFPRLTNIKV
jgi:hypothetical protein